MRKEFIAKNAKKIFAVALATALAAPTALTVNVSSVAAASVPEPVASYNFDNGIEGIEGAEVTNSETIYFVKAEADLAEGEKLDANGLVYTGEGKDAKYVTKAPIGAPTVVDAEDSDKVNKALQFDDTTIEVDEYQKKASAKTEDMSEETAKYLDFQMPKNDYYYVESGSVSANPIKTQSISPQLKLDNPFAGLADELKECDELDDVVAQKVGTKYVPLWEKGVTLSYWIKVPVDEDGVYQNSSVLRWENDNEYYMQADDYSKYLPTKLWDRQYAKLSDEKKEEGLKYSPSGVCMYGQAADGTYNDPEGLLDFYFDYQEGFYEKDENGYYKPVEVTDSKTGKTGPVYDYALASLMKAALKGKTEFTGSARFIFANPNYKSGFYVATDGSTFTSWDEATYQAYNSLPELKDGEGNVTSPSTSYFKLDDADSTVTPGNSNIRYALEDGELQIDADNSIFWVPDNNLGINENSNVSASFGIKAGMQNADVFFMNSWSESRGKDEKENGTYASALYVADSPVSVDNEKNSNAGKWHHVAIVLQNDWVEFYVDGNYVSIEDAYSSRGATSLDTKKSFKRFNKGAGMRNSAGSEKNMGNISYGNYVCRLLMDWISDENSKLCLGGIGNYANEYAQAKTTSKVCLANLDFYSTILTDEQVQAIYSGKTGGVKGDVDGNGTVDLSDATLILKFALNIETPTDEQKNAADMDGNGQIELGDATAALKAALNIQ